MKSYNNPPVFLVGCPRSGTTLLQQMLDAHSAVAIAPETHFIRKFWNKKDSYGDLACEKSYEKLVDDVIALPEFSEMGLVPEKFKSMAWKLNRDYASLFGLLLKEFSSIKEAHIVGEKTPNHLLYMQTLQQFFPNARFIHIVRDPRAVVTSWRTVPWSLGNIKGDARVWQRYMKTARKCPPVAGSLLVLKYEQLVTSPELSLRKACRFLSIPFEPNMLNYYQNDNELVNVTREPWKGNSKKPVSTDFLTRWKQNLEPAEIAEIESIVWLEMSLLKYTIQTHIGKVLVASATTQIEHYWQRLSRRLATTQL